MGKSAKTPEVWPGPMEGVASAAFVRAANSLGLVSRWMTPFLRLSAAVPKKGRIKEFLSPFLEGGVPVTSQLMGTNAELIARAAELCLELGAVGINLNFGCPSRRVVNGGAGGGALKDPDRAAELLANVRKKLPDVPLSVKMRSGWRDFAEFDLLIGRLRETEAAQKFFIHHRTVAEQYLEIPDRLKRFDHIAAKCAGVPLVLNGDIADADEARELVSRTGVSGVMCARTWMRDPYLLRRIEKADAPDPETGREIFYAELVRSGVAGGALIELAKLLFGAADPHFLRLIGG